MTFRDRLLATIEAARPVLEEPDVLVVGSEVPSLSLLEQRTGMPDPRPRRAAVVALLRRLEQIDGGAA